MKAILLISIACVLFTSTLFAQQSSDAVVVEIEKNNTTLAALRQHVGAEKLGNRTGIYLDNPEVGFNYLWGDPSAIGSRKDFSITQSFDFPTAYGYKCQISNMKDEQLELEYEKERMSILLQARLICVDLVYCNALKAEVSKRKQDAQSIATAYQKKFELGETNLLEYNKAQLNLLNADNELESITLERSELLSELANLNGGTTIDFIDSVFQKSIIVADFEQWYVQAEQNNPLLSWIKQEISISQKEVNLNKALSLPKIQAGYMSEKVVGEGFKGISLGLSIPLGENKNRVKYARANTEALQGIENDRKLQYYNRLKLLHDKASGLQQTTFDYRLNLQKFDNSVLLQKAFDKNEISLIDYMLERSIYYESVDKLLDLERDLKKTIARLNQYVR
jgi:outer membrane protein TolC